MAQQFLQRGLHRRLGWRHVRHHRVDGAQARAALADCGFDAVGKIENGGHPLRAPTQAPFLQCGDQYDEAKHGKDCEQVMGWVIHGSSLTQPARCRKPRGRGATRGRFTAVLRAAWH